MKLQFDEFHLLQLLQGFSNQHLPLDLYLNRYFRSHKAIGASDRRFLASTTYGMIRWKLLLDHLLGKNISWERRYELYSSCQVNNFFHATHLPAHVRVSCPPGLFSMLENQYGNEQALLLSQVNNTEAPTTVRINPLKTNRDALLNKWKEYDIIPTKYSPFGIEFKKRINFFELPEFKEGFFEVQDEGSQLIAALVQATSGQQVLDYCAGSGGKTLAFAHTLQGKGQLYLHDVRPFSLAQAKKRLKRAGIQNVQLIFPDTPNLSKLKEKMDWVLVDAPCSGTGTLRRNPDMKWKFSQEMLLRLVDEQRSIFASALPFLSKGARIVYATCSILKEENEEQIDHFIKTHNLKLVAEPLKILPAFGEMDGFFGAVLSLK